MGATIVREFQLPRPTMNCDEARRLLDSGMFPGSQTPDRARLGFHLAHCGACQAYRVRLSEQHLAAMLSQPAAAGSTAGVAVPRVHHAAAPVASAPSKKPVWLPWQLWAAAGLLVAVLVLAFPLLVSLLHTHENLQSIVVTPTAVQQAAALITSTRMPTEPPATATSTPSPLPSATPTFAPTATLTPTAAPPDPGGAVTIALLGSDRRPGERGSARSDALIVMRVDPVRQRVALLSLPRDLYVRIPGYGYGRVNSASTFARDDVAAGAEMTCNTLSALLGIPIDYYIAIDFQGFIAAIDALDGVTVNVPKELYDSRFPTMDYGYANVHFPTGPQKFDGATALVYSRIRHPDSDFGRIKRQQAVLAAVLGRLREHGVHEQLSKLELITSSLRGFVQTDMPEARMVGLGWALRTFTPDAIEHYTMEVKMVTFGVGNDRWAEVPMPGTLEKLTAKLLGKQQTAP